MTIVERRWTALLLAGLLLALCACGEGRGAPEGPDDVPGGQSSDAGGTGPGDSWEHGAVIPADAGPLSLLDSATGDGYYHFGSHDTLDAQVLLYVDYASQREIYLCSNAACAHDTADCAAVFPLDQFSLATSIFTWDGALYILSKAPDQDGSAVMGAGGGVQVESEPAVLYRAGLDGTGRDRVYTFDAGLTVEDFVLGDDDGLYFITKKVSTESTGGSVYMTATDRELVRVDPAAGTGTVVRSMDFGDDIDWDVIGCTGRLAVLHGIDFGRAVPAAEKHGDDHRQLYDSAEDVFAALDIDSGELREFFRVHAASRSYALDGTCLYFSQAESEDILAVDLRTGDRRVLCTLPGQSIWGILGDHLYCRGDSGSTFDFVDVNTGAVSHSGLVQKTLGWSLQFLAEAGDQVLTVYDGDGTPRGDGSYADIRWRYALIAKEDLYAGRDAFRPIQMTGKGW